MADFSITSKPLINYTLSLQTINDVALPFAMQNALNEVAKDVKKRTLAQTTNKMFDIKRKNFFKANSAFKPYKAKQFNYNINKMHADVGITKGTKPNENSTEQVGKQQTTGAIKRSFNPLGKKPQRKKVIDIMNKRPEIVEDRQSLSEWSNAADHNKAMFQYIRGAARAKRRGAGLLLKSGSSKNTGTLMRVRSFRTRKPTKNNHRKAIIKMNQIASYRKGGKVKLNKRAPFLNRSAIKSTREKLQSEFQKAAEKQVELAFKRK